MNITPTCIDEACHALTGKLLFAISIERIWL